MKKSRCALCGSAPVKRGYKVCTTCYDAIFESVKRQLKKEVRPKTREETVSEIIRSTT